MQEPIKREKARLRAVFNQLSQSLPEEYIKRSDRGIVENLLALEGWKRALSLFVYVSGNREPDTKAIILRALLEGKVVAVPRCLDGGIMEARIITSPNELRPGRFGILEPDGNGVVLHPRYIDLVVAPCIAADRQGYRLGYGGGYYDRYLAQVRCTTVCLCRKRLLRESLPHDALDRPVDLVITEDERINQSKA